MELIKVADFYGEDGDKVEITPQPYCGYIAQLKTVGKEHMLSWHQESWIQASPTTNSHVGGLKLSTSWLSTKEEAIAEGRLCLIRFLIEGLEELGVDEQMSLDEAKEIY